MLTNACRTLPQAHFAMPCRHDQEIIFGGAYTYDGNTNETHYDMITQEGKVSDNDFNGFLPKCHVRSKRVLLNLLCVIVRS